MRKALISALMTAPLLLLSACSGGERDNGMRDIQREYASAEKIEMSISLRADYGEKVYDFSLACDVGDTGGSITVKKPDTIAGVTAELDSDGVTLCYDGAEVYTGALLPEGLSPVDAVPVMVRAWSEGLVAETVKEKFSETDCVAAVFRISDTVSLRTWFEEETHLPLHAEIAADGFTVIFCDFENVILT